VMAQGVATVAPETAARSTTVTVPTAASSAVERDAYLRQLARQARPSVQTSPQTAEDYAS
jgi:hypothetical protein